MMKLCSFLFLILLFVIPTNSWCKIYQEDIDENQQALNMVKKAEVETKKIRRDAATKIALLKEQTKDDYFKLKENIDLKRLELENKADLEALKIKAEAERKALELKNKAEMEALRIRQGLQGEKRDQDVQEEEEDDNILKRVSDDWRVSVRKQFDDDISFMKQIVIDGEVNKSEQEEFLGLFKEQKEWFDKTVTSTKYIDDSNYQAITKKKLTIHNIVAAQKKADKILQDSLDKDSLGTAIYQKMRLAVLYELNSLIDKEELSDSEIKGVVKSVMDNVKEQKRKLEVKGEGVTEKLVLKLEKELEKVKKEQEDLKNKSSKFEEDTKIKLEEKNRRNLELEILLQKTRQSLEKLRQEADKLIVTEGKSNLNLQIRLNEVKEELEALKDKLRMGEVQQKELKTKLDEQKGQTKKLEQEKTQLKDKTTTIENQKKELEVELDKKSKEIKKVEHEIKQKEFELKRSLNAGISDKENINRLKMESELILKEKNEELTRLRSQMQEYKQKYVFLQNRPEDEKIKELSLEAELQAKV